MKKIFLSLIVLLFAFVLYGCKSTKNKLILTVVQKEVTLYEGQSFGIDATVEKVDAEIKYNIIQGNDCISLEGNIVTAIKQGNAVVEVSVEGYNELKENISVEVLANPILIIEEKEVSLYEGQTYTIAATLENEQAEIKYNIIQGNDLITLEGNKVTAIREGNAVVEVSVEKYDDLKENISIEIKKLPELNVPTTAITLDNKNKSFELDASVSYPTMNLVYEIVEGDDLIEIEEGVVISKEITSGSATIKVSVEGFPNISQEITVEVIVVFDNEAPVFYFEAAESDKLKLNWGKEVTRSFLLQDMCAIDEVDGDLTDQIKISQGINNKKYGTYIVRYEVTDNAGNTTVEKRQVEVVWDYAVEFIGHQGSYYGAPNSEEAFLYAAEVLQYQALETDVKQTKDGVFVCCHDDTFGGVTIANVTWDELKNIEIESSRTAGYPSQYGEMPGTGKYKAKICTLERYLEICKKYNIKAVVELKGSTGISNSSQTRMPALMELIEQEGMLNNTIFLASAYNCLIWVKQNGYDYIPCQYLVGSCENEEYLQRCITYGLDISINTTYGDYKNSPEWIARYQDAGLKVSTYTYSQYVDYNVVQQWIDLGVDFITTDWHSMHKLNLPENSDIVYHTVKFYDKDDNLIKETKVKDGRTAAAPAAPEIEGYKFTGWDKSISNIKGDIEVKAQYELVEYEIQYDSNLYVLTKTKWQTKADFVNDFYNDLFDWVVANKDNLSCITYKDGVYSIKVNSTEYGSATFSSPQDIKNLYVYNFERTLATLIYKPISGKNSADYVPEIDNNYFLNTEPYRSKYIDCNKYFLNVMQTVANYSGYSQTYQQASNNRVQIFFRFHQWCNGSSIPAFNAYPEKYLVKYLTGVTTTMPTEHTTYTINDAFTLPTPTASIKFLGWYTDRDGNSEKVTEIKVGTTGDIILYAKWEIVEVPEVYGNINYVLNGGENHSSNKNQYLQGIATSLYPAYKEGYKFVGWTEEEGSNNYITTISEFKTGEITLYANYEYEEYNIKYDLQGGTWGTEVEIEGDPTTTISATAKDGFWENGYLSAIYLNSVATHPKAVWSFRVGISYNEVLRMYEVKAISESGKDFDDTTSEYVVTISGSYTNYAQTSAFRSSVKVGQYVKVTGDIDSGVATLEFYDIEDISDVFVENYIEKYNIGLLPATLPVPQYEGKTFKGWSLTPTKDNAFTQLPQGTIGDITLYAVFE